MDMCPIQESRIFRNSQIRDFLDTIRVGNSMYLGRSWLDFFHLSPCNLVGRSQVLARVSFGLFHCVPWWIWGCLVGLWEGSGLQGFRLGVNHIVFLGEVV